MDSVVAGSSRASPAARGGNLREECGIAMHRLIAELYPLCRSITGAGVRETLRRLQHECPLTITEVPSGTPVFDWTVPREWSIRDAYIKAPSGERVVDFRSSNLHVVGYSRPVHARMTLEELKPHLFALPDQPAWIPYRTCYYAEQWGFCLAQRILDSLKPGTYEVYIDSLLADGSLTYGEAVFPGRTKHEILISTHVCHPSLCNDNLSGIVVAAALAQILSRTACHYTYRIVFVPGTIGSLTWLARNPDARAAIKGGLVLTCLGDPGPVTYKRSRDGGALIDRAVAFALNRRQRPSTIVDFSPYGYDERQYNAPGFNLPVGCLMRTPHGQFPEYHTSADNIDFVKPAALQDSVDLCLEIIDVIEHDHVYRNLSPYGEPQLGRRGLYSAIGGERDAKEYQSALLWLLSFSDGRHSLLDIAERAGLSWSLAKASAEVLTANGLLERQVPSTTSDPQHLLSAQMQQRHPF